MVLLIEVRGEEKVMRGDCKDKLLSHHSVITPFRSISVFYTIDGATPYCFLKA